MFPPSPTKEGYVPPLTDSMSQSWLIKTSAQHTWRGVNFSYGFGTKRNLQKKYTNSSQKQKRAKFITTQNNITTQSS